MKLGEKNNNYFSQNILHVSYEWFMHFPTVLLKNTSEHPKQNFGHPLRQPKLGVG